MNLRPATLLLLGSTLPALVQAGPYAGANHGLGADQPVFEGWITGVVDVTRPDPSSGGFSRDQSGGLTNVPPQEAVAGRPSTFAPTGNVSHVVSLGNGGSIIVRFAAPITNGDGADFAVFENAFIDVAEPYAFVELAYVDVGTTTSHWARFATAYGGTEFIYALNNEANDWYASQDATLIDGFAGKHVIDQGTPFDLDQLTNHPSVLNAEVDLGDIRYIRLTDVVGDGSTFATDGNPVYDPYYDYVSGYPGPAPTAGTDGFDLRAIGVVHHQVSLDIDAEAVRWMGYTNATYQLQFHNRTSDQWEELGPAVPGANTLISQPHSNVTSRIYRVKKTK